MNTCLEYLEKNGPIVSILFEKIPSSFMCTYSMTWLNKERPMTRSAKHLGCFVRLTVMRSTFRVELVSTKWSLARASSIYKTSSGVASITYKNPFAVRNRRNGRKRRFHGPVAGKIRCRRVASREEKRFCRKKARLCDSTRGIPVFLFCFRVRCYTRKKRGEKGKKKNALKVISVSMVLKTTTFYIMPCFVRDFIWTTLGATHCVHCRVFIAR